MNIYIAGHRGMVGSAIYRALFPDQKVKIITAERSDVNLLCQSSVRKFLKNNKIDQVYIAAAKVGGIYANNTFPAQFIYENLTIQTNIIHASHLADIQNILFMGSSCIYPKHSVQPIPEDSLLTGPLERTNEPYAIAKIAGIKMCESYNRQYQRNYRSIMPTNLYGPNDNFHPENSHVVPALMRRLHSAAKNGDTEVEVWGSGKPRREFLHVDDLARAAIFLMNIDAEPYSSLVPSMESHVNVGAGIDYTIEELAQMIARITSFKGDLIFDTSKPDGSPRKLLDVSRLKSLGWEFSIGLEQGLTTTYSWYKDNIEEARSL